MKPKEESATRRLKEVKGIPLGSSERIELACDIAKLLLDGSLAIQTKKEKKREKLLASMIQDPASKAFISEALDSCFRTNSPKRIVDQILYLISCYGTPKFQKSAFYLFRIFAPLFPRLATYALQSLVKKELKAVIAPGEKGSLSQFLRKIKDDKVSINLNRLGEAILGEKEAISRVRQNIEDLQNPYLDVISIKISSIESQINLVAHEKTLEKLKIVFRELLRKAADAKKLITLDMEEYKDLALTYQLFKEVLSEPEFIYTQAGIALQSYIPDSHKIQKELTEWALKRVQAGGSPIKIRIVKGANLGMERVEASIKEWPLATYRKKEDVDASFKKMVTYACMNGHAKACHIGIGSHNLFDIAYALVLAAEHDIEQFVTIEMLSGMAPHITRYVSRVASSLLLYVPCAKNEEFHNAVAYLMRRLDENTAPGNFLAHLFDLTSHSLAFEDQKELFCESVSKIDDVETHSYRSEHPKTINTCDLDFSQKENQIYAEDILRAWHVHYNEATLVVGGHNLVSSQYAQGIDPSRPSCKIHTHFLAEEYHANVALEFAKNSALSWCALPLQERLSLLKLAANNLRDARKKLTGCMLQEVAKNIQEGDAEISEAIDFIDYYVKEIENMAHASELFSAKKASLVLSPWNFPLSIPTSGIASSLAAGYSVIFKPAPEAVLCGYMLADCFWRAGISKEVLQFITCRDDPIGSMLVQDPRIDIVILTGATATARRFLEMRPNIQLFAETGGKNTLIVTQLSDRDLAVKDAVQSAFSYAGQKCSALSLLILEEEVYHSESFRNQLRDAAASLVVSRSYNLACKVNPLIREPSEHLMRALTTLDDGESWLLEPKQDEQNPNLFSPGIKLGVKPGSFMHQTELFGPVLGVMCAKNLEEALSFANSTSYGLTAGIHSLDKREQEYWKKHIVAGNLYINRAITGAIVGRQPFGGTKGSSFGPGMKVGGPNYLLQLVDGSKLPPLGNHPVQDAIVDLEGALLSLGHKRKEADGFYKAASSMAFWWDNYFTKPRTLRKLIGQDNILEYRTLKALFLIVQDEDVLMDIFLIMAAARTAGCQIVCGASFKQLRRLFKQGPLAKIFAKFGWQYGSIEEIAAQIHNSPFPHIRSIVEPPAEILSCHVSIDRAKPSRNGRLELIHYVREVAISYDYHRYGSLMARDNEMREATH